MSGRLVLTLPVLQATLRPPQRRPVMRSPRSGFTSFAPTVFVLLLFLANGRTADAQQVKSETYLMQLAAAVSGFSGGQRVWVVMCGTSDPFEVLGVFPSADAAAAAIAQARGK